MTRFEFDQTPEKKIEITSSTLTPEEFALVEAIAKWQDPHRFSQFIRMVNGRSIELQSPSFHCSMQDYLLGHYDGLQIYGAGGTTALPSEGVYTIPDTEIISPLDPANHAQELSHILQLQEIDTHGKLILRQRPYMPLRGMTYDQAENRKRFTTLLSQALTIFADRGHSSWLRVPSIACEGIYPDLFDDQGQPLRFQVYRIPLVPRFPTQVVQYHNFDDILTAFFNFSQLHGKTLRLLHRNHLAYMDGHIGNLSLLTNGQVTRLYATDLGSFHDLSNEPFSNLYKGIDFYMFFASMDKFLDMLLLYLASGSDLQKAFEIIEPIKEISHDALMSGYFYTEMKQDLPNETIPPLASSYARQVYSALLQLDTQGFLEYTDQFLRSSCDTSIVGTPVVVDVK